MVSECPRCGRTNNTGFKLCPLCREAARDRRRQPGHCARCGKVIEEQRGICSKCKQYQRIHRYRKGICTWCGRRIPGCKVRGSVCSACLERSEIRRTS
jgi:hypothetical protein